MTTLDAFLQAGALEPTDIDIIVGSAVTTTSNSGNRRYQEKVAEARPAFWMARSYKRLVEGIRIEMLEEGRRFLRQENDKYFELSRETARKRIAQDLRESFGRDLTEKAKNKRVHPLNSLDELSLDGANKAKKLPRKAPRSQSLDRVEDKEERSTKRTKYEADVASVARSSASAYTDDSAWCLSQESSEGSLNFQPFPSLPMMFPYEIPTGASNPGWRSHGSSSTLNTLDIDLSGIADLIKPIVEVSYANTDLEPLSLNDIDSMAPKPSLKSAGPSCSTLATLQNVSELRDMLHQPIVEIAYSATAKETLLLEDCAASVGLKSTGSDSLLALDTRLMSLKASVASLDAQEEATQANAGLDAQEIEIEEYCKTLVSSMSTQAPTYYSYEEDLSVQSFPEWPDEGQDKSNKTPGTLDAQVDTIPLDTTLGHLPSEITLKGITPSD